MPIDFKTHKTQMTQIAQQQTLKLDKNTTMEQLGTFLSSKSGKAEILAKKDQEGNTILYTREAGAANTFRDIKDRFRTASVDGNRVNVYEHKRQFANSEIAKFLQAQGERMQNNVSALERRVDQGTTFATDLFNVFRTAVRTFGDRSEGQQTTLVGDTVKLLSSIEVLESRVTRSLETMLSFTETIPDLPATKNKALQEFHQFSISVDGKPVTVDAPNLLIDGKIFVPSEVTGMGGFGAVVRYVGPNQEELAVKIPSQSAESDLQIQHEKARQELFNTGRMLENNPNASGFTGHVKLPSGSIALIGSYMSKGDLHVLGGKIAQAHETGPTETPPPPGKIGDFERYIIGLTLLKDSATGLAAMNKNGMTHGDVKSLNVMLGEDGKAKIIDLGDGVMTSKTAPELANLPQTAKYGAPEYGLMREKANSQRKDNQVLNTEFIQNNLEAALKSLDLQEGENNATFLSENIRNIGIDLKGISPRMNNSNLKLLDSYDSFGLGTMGLELLVGGDTTTEMPQNAISSVYIGNWAKSGKDAIGPGGLRQQGSDYGATNRLLNEMLHSDPKERLTPSQIRDHEVMGHPAIGSPESRALILAVQSGDPQQITDAVTRLRDAFQEYL